MPEGRPRIPADIERAVRVEAGHRCAIPTCRQFPIEIEHIVDWAQGGKHEFENLIALCPTCHARKGDGSGRIDRKSLRQYKANLAVLNSRYGDLERRLIESYADRLRNGETPDTQIFLGPGSELSLWYLIRDGYLVRIPWSGAAMTWPDRTVPLLEVYEFTPAGVEFVERWAAAQPLDPPTNDAE